jgi:hypothetical protein
MHGNNCFPIAGRGRWLTCATSPPSPRQRSPSWSRYWTGSSPAPSSHRSTASGRAASYSDQTSPYTFRKYHSSFQSFPYETASLCGIRSIFRYSNRSRIIFPSRSQSRIKMIRLCNSVCPTTLLLIRYKQALLSSFLNIKK